MVRDVDIKFLESGPLITTIVEVKDDDDYGPYQE